MKQRFGAGRFALRRLKAVLRWWFFCWLAFLLTHWVALARGVLTLPRWSDTARAAAQVFFHHLLVSWHQQQLQRLRALRPLLPDFDLSFITDN